MTYIGVGLMAIAILLGSANVRYRFNIGLYQLAVSWIVAIFLFIAGLVLVA
jgi:hypothetical protein